MAIAAHLSRTVPLDDRALNFLVGQEGYAPPSSSYQLGALLLSYRPVITGRGFKWTHPSTATRVCPRVWLTVLPFSQYPNTKALLKKTWCGREELHPHFPN